MSWLFEFNNLLDLSQRKPLTLQSVFLCALPPVALYYVTNVLAVLGPRAFVLRVALLPLTLFMAYRAVFLDLAKGLSAFSSEELNYLNQAWTLGMFTVFTRSLYRTFGSQPRRVRGTYKSTVTATYEELALDAADLTFSLRGLGWDFAAQTKVPPYKRPLYPTSAWAISTLRSLVAHVIAVDFLQYVCQCFDFDTIGSTVGGTIYDMSLEPSVRYLRSTGLTFFNGLIIYGAIQIGHDAFALIAVALFRHQSPSDWPPLFDSPWLATSLTEFWAVRWHQVFRQEFVALGARPLSLVAGRPGAVLGAFSLSGILHFVGLWGMGRGGDPRVFFFFLMMGIGVVAEGLWKKMTGVSVCGWLGRIWAWIQILGWAHLMMDPWCLSGIVGSVFVPHTLRPSVRLHTFIVDILHAVQIS